MKDSTLGALQRYVNHGLRPGGFLEAVLRNDLFEAFARADEDNLRDMKEIVMYVYNEVPSGAWRTQEKIDAWVVFGGIGVSAEEAA